MTAGGIAVSRPADRVRRRRNLAFAVAKYAFLGFWALLCLLPMILIFFAFQRYFIEGIATTGSTGK